MIFMAWITNDGLLQLARGHELRSEHYYFSANGVDMSDPRVCEAPWFLAGTVDTDFLMRPDRDEAVAKSVHSLRNAQDKLRERIDRTEVEIQNLLALPAPEPTNPQRPTMDPDDDIPF